MRRALRLLAVALPLALAAVPVALAGAEPGASGSAQAEPSAESVPDASVAAVDPAGTTAAAVAAARRARRIFARPIAVVRPGRTATLHDRPGGRAVVRLGATTEFGSARRLGVVSRRGRWLGVSTAALPNGTLGWIDGRSPAVAVERTRWSLVADVSRRQVVLRRDGRAVRRLSVAVGRPGSPTPTGRFAITDKLDGSRYGPYYGCCVLALSATQPNTPPGWTGGNRMAIHGTDDQGSIGTAASAGCLRAADADLRFLMESVPAGTPVVVRR
jgi:lipoprotein-anchoring transpeptidase ErfK/SrfK